MTGHHPEEVVEVAIIGFGPVGAVAANLLGQRGLRVRVLEREIDVFDLPRAIHFDGEIMRVLQGLGLAEEMRAAATPVIGVDFQSADGTPVFRARPPPRSPVSGWAHGYTFYQPEFERVLRSAVGRFPNVTVDLGVEIETVAASHDLTTLVTRDASGGTVGRLRARYVLACDGARSTVRRALGIQLADLGFDQPWLVVDAMLRGNLPGLPSVIQQVGDPRRPAAYVPSVRNHRRWEFMLLPGEQAAAMEHPQRISELIAPWVSSRDVDIVRSAVYAFHALVAERWRSECVFLLGDAAHQMPPFLGQGMCAGIRDAANLCWKIAERIRGDASDALLDTYQSEREPHVRAIIQRAIDAGHFLQTTKPEDARARDAVLRKDPSAMRRMGLGQPMPSLGGQWAPPAGEPLPQSLIGSDDVLGSTMTLISQYPLNAEFAGKVITISPTEKFPELALVRPDRYVLAAGARESLPTLLRTMRAYLGGVDSSRC